jgi:hypothetical protein
MAFRSGACDRMGTRDEDERVRSNPLQRRPVKMIPVDVRDCRWRRGGAPPTVRLHRWIVPPRAPVAASESHGSVREVLPAPPTRCRRVTGCGSTFGPSPCPYAASISTRSGVGNGERDVAPQSTIRSSEATIRKIRLSTLPAETQVDDLLAASGGEAAPFLGVSIATHPRRQHRGMESRTCASARRATPGRKAAQTRNYVVTGDKISVVQSTESVYQCGIALSNDFLQLGA